MNSIRRLLVGGYRECLLGSPLGIEEAQLDNTDVYQYRSPINGFSLTLSESGQILIKARCDDGSEITVPTASVVYWVEREVRSEHTESDGEDDMVEFHNVAGDDNKLINDFLLTTIAPALAEYRHFVWDNIVVRNILQYLHKRIHDEIEMPMIHNELKAIVDVCSLAMNVSWVIGKGDWASVPDITTFKWPKVAFQRELEQVWQASSDCRADMLKVALQIDWSGEPQSKALSQFRDAWFLWEDVSTESVLRLAIWHESVFYGDDKPEEIRRVPDWRQVIESCRACAVERARDVFGGVTPEDGEDAEINNDRAVDLLLWEAEEFLKLIKERMPSLGCGPDDFARKKLPPSVFGRDSYSFEEMVLIYKTLDKCDDSRARENCLFEVWKATYGPKALMKAVYDGFERYAESIQSFLVPIGKSGYLVCVAVMPKVELGWKSLIHRVLRQHFGGDEKAWYGGVPETIREDAAKLAERKKGQRSKWDCLYFVDVKTILDKNWKLVEPKIASRKRFAKKYLMDSFDRLNGIRNDLYHPMEGQTFDYADEIDDYLKDVEQFTKEVLGEQGES